MPNIRPGQGFKRFSVMKLGKAVNSKGRVQKAAYEATGTITGILATASQKEIEQWKQKSHPITHKIVQQGIANSAIATNYLVLSEPGKKDRYFYVQGTGNPGELNHMMRYFVEERKDLKDG